MRDLSQCPCGPRRKRRCQTANHATPSRGGHRQLLTQNISFDWSPHGCILPRLPHGGVFSGTPSDCIDCHSEPQVCHTGLSDCVRCHTTSDVTSPTTYRHPRVAEHYPSGEKYLYCTDCHRSTYATYSCTGSGCHSTNNPRDD